MSTERAPESWEMAQVGLDSRLVEKLLAETRASKSIAS